MLLNTKVLIIFMLKMVLDCQSHILVRLLSLLLKDTLWVCKIDKKNLSVQKFTTDNCYFFEFCLTVSLLRTRSPGEFFWRVQVKMVSTPQKTYQVCSHSHRPFIFRLIFYLGHPHRRRVSKIIKDFKLSCSSFYSLFCV